MMDPVGYDPVLDADDDWLIIHVLYHELLTLIIFDILHSNKYQYQAMSDDQSVLQSIMAKITHILTNSRLTVHA